MKHQMSVEVNWLNPDKFDEVLVDVEIAELFENHKIHVAEVHGEEGNLWFRVEHKGVSREEAQAIVMECFSGEVFITFDAEGWKPSTC